MLSLNQPAPEFTLIDSENNTHSLMDYREKWLIIFFYPKDQTPGCTKEVCALRDDYSEFERLHTSLIGINTDTPDKHFKFSQLHTLPFTLLADPQGKVSALYGALFKIGPIKLTKRHSIIINPAGHIVKIYRSVKPNEHSQELLNDLKQLQAYPIL